MSATSGRFSIIPARAVDDNRLEPAALLVLTVLGTYSDRDGYCWPSQETIAGRIRVSQPAVARQIKILHKLGYIAIKRMWDKETKKTHNAYKILFDAELQPDDDEKTAQKQVEPEDQPDTDITLEVISQTTDITYTGGTDITSSCYGNVPLTTHLINTPEGEKSMDADEYKKRIEAAYLKGLQLHAGKVDVSNYPEEVQKTLQTFCALWHMDPPLKSKRNNSECADWIQGGRDINDACNEFGLDLMALYAEEFEKYKAEHQGLAPFRVTRPGSIVKSLRGLAAEVRSKNLAVGSAEKTIVIG